MSRPRAALVAFALGLSACGGCKKDEAGAVPATSASGALPSAPAAVAEAIPRCRQDGARAAADGDDVVFGDAVVTESALLVGLVRTKDGSRRGAVLRATPDLGKAVTIDVADVKGDDPSPMPFIGDGKPFAAYLTRKEGTAGTTRGMRELRIVPLGDAAAGAAVATIVMQADESTAFDVAWPLAAWDEDARVAPGKFLPERGVVKVQRLPDGAPRVISPERSDAESPQLAPKKGGGFWALWLARRPEVEDAGYRIEGAGDLREYRAVEVVALDDAGQPTSPVRRITAESGRALAFDVVATDPELVVLVQDEAEASEGAGSRLVRVVVGESTAEPTAIVDGGIGQALVEVAPGADGGWIAWKDEADHAWIAPATATAILGSRPTAEVALDGARVLAAAGGGAVYAASGREVRRFVCAK